MIAHVYCSESDRESLSKIKTILPTGGNCDYSDVIVNKPWGYEYLMYENHSVAIWVLHIKKGGQTSMHCHRKKRTSLIVLSGQVVTSCLETRHRLGPVDGIIIEESTFHTTRAVSSVGAVVIEIESPVDKSDLVRLNDSYGRKGAGYEGPEKHLSGAQRDRVTFARLPAGQFVVQRLAGRDIGLSKASAGTPPALESIPLNEPDVIGLLAGTLSTSHGQIVLRAGEIMPAAEILRGEPLTPSQDVGFFHVSGNGTAKPVKRRTHK